MSWIAAVVQLLGVFLNARKNIACWPAWCVGAILWMIYGVTHEQWAMVFLNVFFFVFNLYGWRAWHKERQK